MRIDRQMWMQEHKRVKQLEGMLHDLLAPVACKCGHPEMTFHPDETVEDPCRTVILDCSKCGIALDDFPASAFACEVSPCRDVS